MVQHYPYYPPLHGHYYFRPYSYNEMVAQREVALLIGEDRQNPYSNRIFAQIYRAYDERHPATGAAAAIQHIVMPLDGSPLSESIIPEAVQLAKRIKKNLEELGV